jgi:hypothetical protein
MIKPTIKVEGLEKLGSELRKEADKIVKEEIRKQQAKHQNIVEDEDADPFNPKSDIGRINAELEVTATPLINSSQRISARPKISSGIPLRKKP